MRGKLSSVKTQQSGAFVYANGEHTWTWMIDLDDEDRTRIFGQWWHPTMRESDQAARRVAAKLGIELEA